MATLPKAAPRAENVSTAVADFGVIGRGIEDFGRGVAQGLDAINKQKAEEADRWATQAFTGWQTEAQARVSAAAAGYDGKAPGLTQSVLAEADASFQPLLDKESDPTRRAALQARFDGYRAQMGGNLAQVEAAKRAEPIRLQMQAQQDTDLASDTAKALAEFSRLQTTREASGLGAMTAQGRLDDYDAAVKLAIEAAPEDRRPRLQAALAARRVDEFVLGQQGEERAKLELARQKTGESLDLLANTLLSDPSTYSQAKKLIPRLAAGIPDAAERMKFEENGREVVASSFVLGLVNKGQLGLAQTLLNNGQLDQDLKPAQKQQYLGMIEAGFAAQARARRIAARGGDGDEEDGGGVAGLPAGGPSFDNTKSGYASDPLKYAHKKAIAPVAPMDANWGLQEGAGAGQWGQVLQQRRAVGIELSRRDSVPQRILTNAEKEFYQDAFERDPGARYRFAIEARKAIGETGAAQLMTEIGSKDEAPVRVVLGALAAAGSPEFARKAQMGVTLKAQGAEITPAERRNIAAQLEPYRQHFAAVPSTFLGIQQAAEAAYLADKASGTLAQPEWYALRALGGKRVNDTTYGGGTIMRKRRTLVPDWLNPDYADDALRTLGEVWSSGEHGPRYGNGKPVPAAQIARSALKLMPNGWYQLVNDAGETYVQKNGRPFMFNLDRDRQFLAKKLGAKAVLGGN